MISSRGGRNRSSWRSSRGWLIGLPRQRISPSKESRTAQIGNPKPQENRHANPAFLQNRLLAQVKSSRSINRFLILHGRLSNKDDIKSALLRVSDSIAYVAAARHVYAVIDDPEIKDAKLFVKAKNNLARDTKALRYGIGVKTVGHDAKLGVDINAPFIVWHPQYVEITANEAMQAAGSHTAKREAREFLLERLEAGPANSEDLIEEAKQEGIAEKTLR